MTLMAREPAWPKARERFRHGVAGAAEFGGEGLAGEALVGEAVGAGDGAASSRRFFLLRMTEEAADDAAEIAQVAPDEFVHQVGFRSINRPAHLEIDRRVTRRHP